MGPGKPNGEGTSTGHLHPFCHCIPRGVGFYGCFSERFEQPRHDCPRPSRLEEGSRQGVRPVDRGHHAAHISRRGDPKRGGENSCRHSVCRRATRCSRKKGFPEDTVFGNSLRPSGGRNKGIATRNHTEGNFSIPQNVPSPEQCHPGCCG